jgi:hypothetical protein
MREKKRQVHVRLGGKLLERLERWLRRQKRLGFGARGAEIELMIEEGMARRERAERRK